MRANTLVLDDGGLRNLPQLVKGGARQVEPTLRAAVLEPPMLGTIDLHELTQTIAPGAIDGCALDGLSVESKCRRRSSIAAVSPRRDPDHEAPIAPRPPKSDRNPRMFAHNGQHRLVKHCAQCSVAWPATLPRNQPIRPDGAERMEQPINLSSANPDQTRRVCQRKASIGNIDQHPQTRQLFAAHRDHRHPTPPDKPHANRRA